MRDAFQILAFHDASAKTFDALDPKLERLAERCWGGKPLPFPILLDATGRTVKTFGVIDFPTMLLIDPQGRVVRGASARLLAAKLEQVRARRADARAGGK